MAYRAGIVGAAGYAGVELVRRLLEHPGFELSVVTSDGDAGTALDELYPAFTGTSDLVFQPHDAPALTACDVVFLAVPHTAAMARVPDLLAHGVTCIDLSADFRLKDPAVYERWYGVAHTAPELLKTAAFGLPELAADELAAAAARRAAGGPALVACAGCYVTASTLAAAPAVRAGLTEGVINVHAVSGVTGAGRKPGARTHFCHAEGNAEAYGVGAHRHQPEMEQVLGVAGRVLFAPHLVPMRRGILSTVSMQVNAEAAAAWAARELPQASDPAFDLGKAHLLYTNFYRGRPFVQMMRAGSQPQTASVAGTNYAHVGLAWAPATGTLVATCAIDNLGKGAADQAVQCANIVFGLPEDAGLASMALPV